MEREKIKSIAKCVMGVLGVAGVLTIAAVAPNSVQMLKMFGLKDKRYKTKSVYSSLRRMQNQRLIEITERDGQTIISITEKGKKRFLSYNFETMTIFAPKKWDGKWRIVGFDIPEKKKSAREALRKKIRELGFMTLQKSLFVLPYDCKKEIEFIGEFFGVGKCIVYAEASFINNQEYYKERFNLTEI